jgi:hypothetical protein
MILLTANCLGDLPSGARNSSLETSTLNFTAGILLNAFARSMVILNLHGILSSLQSGIILAQNTPNASIMRCIWVTGGGWYRCGTNSPQTILAEWVFRVTGITRVPLPWSYHHSASSLYRQDAVNTIPGEDGIPNLSNDRKHSKRHTPQAVTP